MDYWNEQDGVYEFRDTTPAETARRRTAADSSRWVRCQLEWCQPDPTAARADSKEIPSLRMPPHRPVRDRDRVPVLA